MAYNKNADREQYERYKEVLRDEALKTFEEFQNIKYEYGQTWENYKSIVRTKNHLQEHLDYIYNGEKLFIPRHALLKMLPQWLARGRPNLSELSIGL